MSLALGSARGTVLGALRWHRRQLQERPVLTNSLTSCVLMLIGDRLAQRLERKRAEEAAAAAAADGAAGSASVAPYDSRRSWTRTAILCSWSLCLSSPFWVKYYRWLAYRWPNRTMLWVAATAAVAVPFNTLFFTYGTLMEHVASHPAPMSAAGRADASSAVLAKLDARLVNTLTASTQLWPVVNWVMFTFVPLELRNLFSSCFALGWNCFMSLQHGASATGVHPASGEQLVTEDVALLGGAAPRAGDAGSPSSSSSSSSSSSPSTVSSFTSHVARQVVEGYQGSVVLQALWGLRPGAGGGDGAGSAGAGVDVKAQVKGEHASVPYGALPPAPSSASVPGTSANRPGR
jgi:protein Mpv17